MGRVVWRSFSKRSGAASRLSWMLAAGALSGCGGNPESMRCDGLEPKEGTPLGYHFASLNYPDLGSTAASVPGAERAIVEDEATWADLVGVWGEDGGLSPDFSTEIVFVSPWVYTAEGEAEYFAWSWGEPLRMRVWGIDYESRSDLEVPVLDLLVVSRGESSDFGWCEERVVGP